MSKSNGKWGKREEESIQIAIATADEPYSPHFTHQDYTVGWICALPKEQTALKAESIRDIRTIIRCMLKLIDCTISQ